MKGIIRIATAVPNVYPGLPLKNAESMKALLKECETYRPDVILFPSLSISGASCGSLFKNRAILNGCSEALERIKDFSAQSDAIIVVGLPENIGGKIYSVCAVLYKGEEVLPRSGERHPLPPLSSATTTPSQIGVVPFSDAVLKFDNLTIRIIPGDPAGLPLIAGEEGLGADIILCPCAMPAVVGTTEKRREGAKTASMLYSCAVATCGCGFGETTSPHLFKGFSGFFECGKTLCFETQDTTDPLLRVCDIDVDVISAQRSKQPPLLFDCPVTDIPKKLTDRKELLRSVRTNPYLPPDIHDTVSYLIEIFDLQVRSLMGRISNAGISKIILGLSGGLDSTLALLVCVSALDRLGLPRNNCTAVTMPGFGTTDRTYYNARTLIKSLCVLSREVPIKASVLQHFEDIGHKPELRDVTFENAQARERAQILFDLSNIENAIVVGTGDLSEEALGWCTFGGDHLATYNVNICLPKTIIRSIVKFLSGSPEFCMISEILEDILDTPVSPELLPPDEHGETTQKTESILGPYELHDFFLYYFVEYNLAPTKIFSYACIAFGDVYSKEYIKATLTIFIRRFFSGQFKRNCSPDSALIFTPCLSEVYFSMPSDASSEYMIDELIDA